MKQKAERVSDADKKKIDKIISDQNTYRYSLKDGVGGLVVTYERREIFTGVAAQYFKSAIDKDKRSKSSYVDERALKAEFEKYALDVWDITSKSNGYSGKLWVVKNTETGDVYQYGDATYLAALHKIKEDRENRVKLSPLEALRNEILNGKFFSTLRSLYARDGRTFDSFLKNYKNKSVSYKNVLMGLYQGEFKYPVPKHFLSYMVNTSLPDVIVKQEGSYRRTKKVEEVSRALTDGFGVFYKHNGEDYKDVVNLTPDTDLNQIRFLKNNVWMWSALIGNGFSFHRYVGKYFFTKAESNTFLNPPVSMSVEEALAFAVAFNASKDYSRSLTVSKISILNTEIVDLLDGFVHKRGGGDIFTFDKRKLKFVFDCIRFLAMNKSSHSLDELSDLADYLLLGFYPKKLVEVPYTEELLRQEGHENPYVYISVFGRKLVYEKLKEMMVDWHHELARTTYMGNSRWEGLPLEDYVVVRKEHGADIEYHFNQILKGSELAEEGRELRHCVSGYKDRCAKGSCAIISMKRVTPSGKMKRLLTLEVLNSGKVVQVRGLANRAATTEERVLIGLYKQQNLLS